MGRFLIIFVYILSILPVSSLANMASPEIRGSNVSEPYSSRDIDIVSELLQITIKNPYQAEYKVVYTIHSDKDGTQIPLIFDTMSRGYSYNDDQNFRVWIDNIEIPVSEIPHTYDNPEALQWIDSISRSFRFQDSDLSRMSGFKYFEANISKGAHIIRAEYLASATVDLHNPINEFRFDYNLKPARFWRSFGNLKIKIDASALPENIETNITDSAIVSDHNILQWDFRGIPQDELSIKYIPPVNGFAKVLIKIGAANLANISIIVLIALHIYFVIKYRRKHPEKRFSSVVIIGSLIIPFIYFTFYLVYTDLIDWVIGEYASKRHGYIFLIYFMYIIVMPIYLLIMWLVDLYIKQGNKNRRAT